VNRHSASQSSVSTSSPDSASTASSSGPNRNDSIASSSRPVPATTPYRRPVGSRRANVSNTQVRNADRSRSAEASMVNSYRSVSSAVDGTGRA
jgi:hypothetical protein